MSESERQRQRQLGCLDVNLDRHHVVLEAEDAMVYVQLAQLLLVYADLVLLLDLHDAGLHLLPRHIGQLRLAKTKHIDGVLKAH